ncbi:MAG: UDP-N-acetylglucosamine 1-carboxyvinyltransferase, partial [Clostridia bacterium]|nr:UDP-N-acetylglucosamine 1-carboxyvinyltransferase [Clostridia bacterium]
RAFSSEHCDISWVREGMRVRSDGHVRAKSVITAPFPLFPTDMQPQFTACQCFSDGVSRVVETVFENRLNHVFELRKMGAQISVSGDCAVIRGVSRGLHPADMTACDLRGGAGLSVAALKVEGESRIYNPHFIDRGYEKFEETFSALGADMRRVRKD